MKRNEQTRDEPTLEGPSTLADYPQPVDKMPAFIGGKGVLVKKDPDGGLLAQVFPIARGGSRYEFTHKDGSTRSTITNDNVGWNARSLQVIGSPTGPGGARVRYTVDEIPERSLSRWFLDAPTVWLAVAQVRARRWGEAEPGELAPGPCK